MRTAACLLVVAAVVAISLGAWPGTGEEGDSRSGSRLATLRKHDPLTQSISLGTGRPGHVFSTHAICNRQSDVDFGNYNEGCFTVGIEGGRRGTILDLGSPRDLAKRYQYDETVGAGRGYASIRLEDGRLVIRTRNGGRTTQPIRETRALFRQPRSGDSAPVVLGHIYVVRITDRHDASFERIAKLQVVGHTAGDSVTIRWDLLRESGGRRRR